MKKKPKKGTKLVRGDDYYERTKDKYRNFRIIKGERVAVKNTLIEKRNKRLDMPGETRRMTVAQFKAQGKSLRESIIRAGENRIRPIIMTSLTTILALFPLTLGLGQSAALRSPMAIAVIAGLITSTLLTLVVIPCVYYVFDKAKDRIFGVKEQIN